MIFKASKEAQCPEVLPDIAGLDNCFPRHNERTNERTNVISWVSIYIPGLQYNLYYYMQKSICY